MFYLHKLVFSSSSGKHPGLYLRRRGGWVADPASAVIRLAPGQGVSSDTYFGTFPWAQWRRIAELSNLQLRFEGSGRFRFSVYTLEAKRQDDQLLLKGILDLDGQSSIDIFDSVAGAHPVALYVELVSETNSDVREVAFVTTSPPRRNVDLGLVVTTFGRATIAKVSIVRLTRLIEADPESNFGCMRLIVVDNGGDLEPEDSASAVVLRNPNVGGAGGFARGLSHLLSETDSSHALFMDDDAATEDECLLRARRLLAFSKDDRLAITAAMLRSERSYLVHEQGALLVWGWNRRIISRKNGLNLLKRSGIACVSRPESLGYGGWWFFAFPIRGKLRFPYPLFVRGDDWLFSYLNDFSIEASMGVASWQEGFEAKIAPLEQYLATKAFLVAELVLRERVNPLATALFFGRWLLRNLSGYCYDRGTMNCEAVADVLKGPSFWENNVALGERLAALRLLIKDEFSSEFRDAECPTTVGCRRLPVVNCIFRSLSLNGHLIPSAFLLSPVTIRRTEAPQTRLTFGRRRVHYVDKDGHGFVVARDVSRFLSLVVRMSRLLLRLLLSYRRLRSEYLASVDRVCTQGWWDTAIWKSARARSGFPDSKRDSRLS